MNISDFQQWVKKTDDDTQWNCLTTLQLLAHLTEEVGELAQSINRIYGYVEEREAHLANLGREAMDVFWLLVKITNRFDVDLDREAQEFVKRVDSLRYPTFSRVGSAHQFWPRVRHLVVGTTRSGKAAGHKMGYRKVSHLLPGFPFSCILYLSLGS